jgi:hypothetical protein
MTKKSVRGGNCCACGYEDITEFVMQLHCDNTKENLTQRPQFNLIKKLQFTFFTVIVFTWECI